VTTRETLLAAADLVDRGWCRNRIAMDGFGKPCEPHDPKACRWCVMGAIRGASRDGGEANEARRALRNHLQLSATVSVPDWNDRSNRTQAEVSAALRAAAGGAA
jgi:hypothetical protein